MNASGKLQYCRAMISGCLDEISLIEVSFVSYSSYCAYLWYTRDLPSVCVYVLTNLFYLSRSLCLISMHLCMDLPLYQIFVSLKFYTCMLVDRSLAPSGGVLSSRFYIISIIPILALQKCDYDSRNLWNLWTETKLHLQISSGSFEEPCRARVAPGLARQGQAIPVGNC